VAKEESIQEQVSMEEAEEEQRIFALEERP
jgi:hypothetical protein